MFLLNVSDFVEFLSAKDHSLKEILSHMTLRVFSPLNASATFLCELNDENLIECLGVHGVGKDLTDQFPIVFSFNEPLPISDAMRSRKVVWIHDYPTWPEEYPSLRNLPVVKGAKTFISVPIEKSGTPAAAIGIFCNSDIIPDPEIETFLKAIANVLSLHVFRGFDVYQNRGGKDLKSKVPPLASPSAWTKLTERQMLILRMMSEGRTNLAISELLGYSESTVRQETIKIFAALQCNGREEASRIYREKLEEISVV